MKRHNLKGLLVILPLLLLSLAAPGFCQSDAQHFAEGRLAFDKYKDCPAAEKALQKVSLPFRKNPAWIMYMARIEECQKNFAAALTFYQQYDALVPGNSEVLNRIGDLSYQMHKEEVSQSRGELEGTWVALTPATDRSFGRVRRLTISSSGDAFTGTFREADFEHAKESIFAAYYLGTMSLQRADQAISLSWKNAASRASFESSDEALYPQDSSGTLQGGRLTLKLQWSADSWSTITFAKSTSAEGISTIKAALQIIDSFVDAAKSAADSDRSDAQQQRGFARDDLASARHFSDDDGDEKAARESRRDAAKENGTADEKMKSARENTAAANQASNYKGNWTSLLQ